MRFVAGVLLFCGVLLTITAALGLFGVSDAARRDSALDCRERRGGVPVQTTDGQYDCVRRVETP